MLDATMLTFEDIYMEHDSVSEISVYHEDLQFSIPITVIKKVIGTKEIKIIPIEGQDMYFILDFDTAERMYTSHKREWLVNNSVLDQVEEEWDCLKDYLEQYVDNCVDYTDVSKEECLVMIGFIKQGIIELQDKVNKKL